MSFDIKDYWLPEQGKLLCQNCGKTIKAFDPNTNKWIKLPGFTLVHVALSDGSYADIKSCKGCSEFAVDFDKDPGLADKIRDQFVEAFKKEKKNKEANDFKQLKVLENIRGRTPQELAVKVKKRANKYRKANNLKEVKER